MKKPAIITIAIVLIMWLSHVLGIQNKHLYVQLGILPRSVKGLISIFTGPFIHGDWEHLIFNTSSFVVLNFMLFYFYKNISDRVFALAFIVTGLLTWAFARDSYHIGMSGVIYAEFGFLFVAGFLSSNRAQIVASFITVLFYGSMLWGIFPGKIGVSWESHLFGFITGLLCILLFNKDLFTGFYKFEETSDEDEYMRFNA